MERAPGPGVLGLALWCAVRARGVNGGWGEGDWTPPLWRRH
jgi:hypothetical protein